jgi:dephospho-CoA kinase
VFANPEELATLESITHPDIFDTIRHRVEEVAGSVVVEIPVLRHGLGEDWCRIVVDSRDETRLERAMNRGMSKKDAQHRIARQPSRREWLAAADLVIPNHGSENELEEAAIQLIAQLSPE